MSDEKDKLSFDLGFLDGGEKKPATEKASKASMRVCAKCNKEYDDTWTVCLDCGEKLSIGDISVPKKEEGVSASVENIRFFYVSTPRLIISSVLSFGIYEVYWCYRNWKLIRDQERQNISPFWRAWFRIFFIHGLFKNIFEAANQKGYRYSGSISTLTTSYILCLIAGNISGRIDDSNPAGWILFGVGMFTVASLIPAVKAVKYISEESKIDYKDDSKYTKGQLAILIGGAIFWILVLIGWFLPS